MSRQNRQEYFSEETESFEAFELVTEALENIDSYDPLRENVEVLTKAQSLLAEALSDGKDPNYLKARYFQAMVSYMRSEPGEAVSQFEQMPEVDPRSSFGQELKYNTAAAYSAAENWEAAIERFDEVIKNTEGGPEEKDRRDNPGLRLLARAGKALSYAGRIDVVQIRLAFLRGEEGEEAAASIKRNEERIKEYSGEIQEQYKFARADAGKVAERGVVKEAEGIIREAYEKLKGRVGYEVVELLPAEGPKKSRGSFAGITRVIVGVAVVVVILALFVQIVMGWDNLRKLLKLFLPK